MQQTEKYKLNLIETGDTFSPNPLNENMEKVENVLMAHEAEVAGQTADLDARLKVFEAKKFTTGTYRADNQNRDFNLGFNPKLVVVFAADSPASHFGILLEGFNCAYGLSLIDDGFRIQSGSYYTHSGYNYFYFAFG